MTFWVTCNSSVVNSDIFKDVRCCKLREKIGDQIMADILRNTYEEAPPFTYSTVDIFRSFIVKIKWSDTMNYGNMLHTLIVGKFS